MARVFGLAVLVGFLSLSSLSQVLGQGISTVSEKFDGAPFTIGVESLRGVSALVPVSKEFGAKVLYEEGKYQISADGRLTYTHREVYRVDSEAAVTGWAEVSAQWDPWYEDSAQIHARVLQPDGTFVDLDQKTITDAPVKGDDSETYSSAHVRRAPLPGMAIGSIVEEEEIIEGKTPYFSGGSVYGFAFRDNVPVARKRLIVEMPSSLPYKEMIHDLPKLVVDRKDADGQRRVVYVEQGIEAARSYDIDLPTNEPIQPMVEFATGSSWGAVAKAYAGMSDPQTVTAEAEAILPKTLPAERMAKIRAIVKELHRDVRYTGVEFGAARLTPVRPSEVIARHYGDCKDKATLLVAMLRAAGVKANLALLSVGPGRDVDAALPGINMFDHAIVYVPADDAGSKPIWIDATAEYFAVGFLPYDDEGRRALVISPETTALTQIPEPKP